MKAVSQLFRQDRSRRLFKEGSWLVAGNVLTILATLALVRVLTEKLDPAQFGQLALGLTIAGLVNQVVMGGLTQGIARFYSIAAEKRDVDNYLAASWRLMGYATGIVVAIGLALLLGIFWLGYSHWLGLAAVVTVFSIGSAYNSVLGDVQNAARQRALGAVHGVAGAVSKILLAVVVMAWLGNSSTAVVIGYTLSSFLIAASQIITLRRGIPRGRASASDPKSWMVKIWAYSLPFTTWGMFSWVQQSSDRWALQAFASTADVGQYVVLFQLGYSPAAMIIGLTMSFLGPILFQRSGEATDHARNANVHALVWKITRSSITITLIAFVATYATHRWLFQLLVASEYRESSHLLPWIVLAGGLFSAGQMLSLKLLSEMKSSAMTRVKIVTALLGTLFNVAGAKIWGANGVIGAQLAFSGVYFVWMVMLGRKSSANHV